MSLEDQFHQFAKFGDTRADGNTITLTQIDKWLKQAGVVDMKKITTTDTGICFGKFKAKTLHFNDFVAFVEMLAKEKKQEPDKVKGKLTECGAPGMNKTTAAVKVGAVDRLTDTSQYTGAHKERFDESGKGKGMEGRADVHDNQGYVGNYKGKDTYDKSH